MSLPIRFFFASVWLINGLWCKVLGEVPRHHEIVAVILGRDRADLWVLLIGIGETFLAIWILSGRFLVACGWVQIVLVLAMNFMEQALVPGFLLWGRWNLRWAFGFVALVGWFFVREERR